MNRRLLTSGLLCAALATVGTSQAAEVIRHKLPNSDFPIALAVEVPASATVINLSGVVPGITDPSAAKNSIKAYGDTETQTVNVLQSIEKNLQSLGLKIGDVVKMQVYLVGDPAKGGQMDFSGFMKGYTQFFGGTKQPNLPVRSTFQVAGLANPGYLVEIEVVAVRP